MSTTEPSLDLKTLLREFESEIGRPQAGMTMRPNEFRQPDVDVVAINGQPVPRHRLAFQQPPALPTEPSFDEKIEGVLAPFREKFDAAQDLLARKMDEAEQALQHRNDIERAFAALRGVETGTPRPPSLPSPRECFEMTDLEWSRFKESLENGEYR